MAFVRYDGRAIELMLLDLASREVRALTTDGAVNVEPRWSPDGDRLAFVSTARTGHFLLHVADDARRSPRARRADDAGPSQQRVARYYYSPFDHAINPTWTRDGGRWCSSRIARSRTAPATSSDGGRRGQGLRRSCVHHEETSWHARPDVSPDGTQIVYSSYLGRQWQQLWLLPRRRRLSVSADVRRLRQHQPAMVA